MKKILTCLIYNTIAFFLIVTNAYAYLDPATGSIIIQYIVAAVVACIAFTKNIKVKFKNFFNKKTKSKKNKEENSKI